MLKLNRYTLYDYCFNHMHISSDVFQFLRNGSAGAMEQNPVTLEERKVGVAAPKMFAFDNVFTDMDPQEEVANSALSDIIASGKYFMF